MRKRYYSLLILISTLCWAQHGYATTVQRLDLEQLNQVSDMVLHARIAQIDEHYGDNEGVFRTLIHFEIIETLKGEQATTFEMILPGGQAGQLFSWIPGMPRFELHDEVVVFLEKNTNGTYAFTGLGQGVFFIDTNWGLPILKRQLDGMHLFSKPGSPAIQAPGKLGPFLKKIRSHVRGLL